MNVVPLPPLLPEVSKGRNGVTSCFHSPPRLQAAGFRCASMCHTTAALHGKSRSGIRMTSSTAATCMQL